MKYYDVIIVGAGSAGLTAGLYAARSGLGVAVMERSVAGGQLNSAGSIDNYTGFGSIEGWELSGKMNEHAIQSGAEVLFEDVKSIVLGDKLYTVTTDAGEYECMFIVLAMGAAAKKLGIKGEDELVGQGISYCASCDGAFFKGKTVAVAGNGARAEHEAEYMAALAEKVYFVTEGEVSEGFGGENIEVIRGSVTAASGLPLKSIEITDSAGKVSGKDVAGLFVAVGYRPMTALVRGLVDLDEKGHIITDEEMVTSAGVRVLAAGDVRKKAFRQVATAVSDGAMAVFTINKNKKAVEKQVQ